MLHFTPSFAHSWPCSVVSGEGEKPKSHQKSCNKKNGRHGVMGWGVGGQQIVKRRLCVLGQPFQFPMWVPEEHQRAAHRFCSIRMTDSLPPSLPRTHIIALKHSPPCSALLYLIGPAHAHWEKKGYEVARTNKVKSQEDHSEFLPNRNMIPSEVSMNKSENRLLSWPPS